MPDFIHPKTTTDPEELVEAAYDFIQSVFPQWEPSDAQLESAIIEANGRMVAEAMDVASDVPLSIFRFFGNTILGVPPIDATPATAPTTWTAVDNAGYTIEAGAQLTLQVSGSELVAFEVVDEVTIPPGDTSVAGVLVQAVVEGEDGSGLNGDLSVAESTGYEWVASVALDEDTSGGQDAELDETYIVRLVDEASLLTGTPILPDDFSIIYRRIPGVYRAVTIDGLDPSDDSLNNERMVTMFAVDEDGEQVSAPIKAAGQALLESLREVTFVVNTDDPTYSTVDVVLTGVALQGWDASEVDTRVEAAVADFLSPANWGFEESVLDDDTSSDWRNIQVLRYLELASAINQVSGFDYLSTLTFGARKAATGVTSTDAITSTAHGYLDGDPVKFVSKTGGSSIVVGTTYYVRDKTANTFKIASTVGGAALDLGSDITVGQVVSLQTDDVTLSGVVPLPRSGTVDSTVTAP